MNLGEAYSPFYCTHLPPTHHHHCQAHSMKLNLLTYLALMRDQGSLGWDKLMFYCATFPPLVSVGPSEEQSFCLNLIAKIVFSESVLNFPLPDVKCSIFFPRDGPRDAEQILPLRDNEQVLTFAGKVRCQRGPGKNWTFILPIFTKAMWASIPCLRCQWGQWEAEQIRSWNYLTRNLEETS